MVGRSHRSAATITLLVLALLLSACGGSTGTPATAAATAAAATAAATASAAPTPSTPPNLGKLRINESVTAPYENGYLFVAIDQGYFKEQGLEVERVPSANDQTHQQLFLSGQIDIMKNGAPAAIVVAQKTGAKIISVTLKNYPFVLVGPKSITTIKDLEGKTLGISAPGAISEIVPKVVLAKLGGDPSKVKVAPVGGTQARLAAVVAGKIDATAMFSYQAPTALAQAPGLHVIQDLAGTIPDILVGAGLDVAGADTIKNRSAALQAYITGIMKGMRFVYERPMETAAIVKKFLKDEKLEDVQFAFNGYSKSELLPINLDVTKAAWDETSKVLLDFKQIESAAAYGVVDMTFVNAALQKLGRASYRK